MWLLPALLLLLLFAPGEGLASTGSWVIQNHCNFPVFYIVTLEKDSLKNAMYPNQITMIEYQNKEDGSGMSIKLAKTENDLDHGTNELQLESTINATSYQIFYDLSRVDDRNDLWVGYSYFAESTNHPECRLLTCLAGDYRCPDEYVLPWDDYATTACSLDSITNVHLCASPLSFSTDTSTRLPSSSPYNFVTSFIPSPSSSCSGFNYWLPENRFDLTIAPWKPDQQARSANDVGRKGRSVRLNQWDMNN